MKRGWVSRASCGGLAVVALACGEGGSKGRPDREPVPCPANLSYAATAQPFVAKYCLSCHGARASDRRGAPSEASFDDLAGLRAHGTMVHDYVQEGVMPPDLETLPQPSAQERDDFVAWTVCSGVAGEHDH